MICRCLALVAAAFLIVVCCDAQESRDAKAKDRRLLEAITAVAEKGTEPDKVESAVGVKTTINTIRKEDRDTFSMADIAKDPERKPALPARESLKWVAYWVRPIDSRNPKIVGIFWPKEGKPHMFYGKVLPPR